MRNIILDKKYHQRHQGDSEKNIRGIVINDKFFIFIAYVDVFFVDKFDHNEIIARLGIKIQLPTGGITRIWNIEFTST